MPRSGAHAVIHSFFGSEKASYASQIATTRAAGGVHAH